MSAKVNAISSENLAYIAGLTDGEGSLKANVYIHRARGERPRRNFQNALRVRFADELTIRWLQEVTGVGCVYREDNGRYRTMWNWQVSGKQCADILLAIMPYLRTKKRQAQLVLQLRTCVETYVQPRDKKGRCVPIDEDEERLRIHISRQISRLNRGLPEEGLDTKLPPQLYLPIKKKRLVRSEYIIGINGLSATYAAPSPASSRPQSGRQKQ